MTVVVGETVVVWLKYYTEVLAFQKSFFGLLLYFLLQYIVLVVLMGVMAVVIMVVVVVVVKLVVKIKLSTTTNTTRQNKLLTIHLNTLKLWRV